MKLGDLMVGIVHCVIWIGFIVLCESVFADSPAKAVYGSLCAWWATLYAASVLATKWRAVAVFVLAMTLALFVDAIGSWNRLYHDTPTPLSIGFVAVAGLQWVVWASPFVVNAAVAWLRDRILGLRSARTIPHA
jgi:hypothetical protein